MCPFINWFIKRLFLSFGSYWESGKLTLLIIHKVHLEVL
ncbi:Hypothetical protein ADU73_0717 [Pediococcus damnosus]|nr:Hypothetical protein ADU73_0717 [Pediococcus damnosus]